VTNLTGSEAAVYRLYTAINERNFGALDTLLSDDWIDHLEKGAGDKAGLIQAIARVIASLPDFYIQWMRSSQRLAMLWRG
jgi:hypothetical protein